MMLNSDRRTVEDVIALHAHVPAEIPKALKDGSCPGCGGSVTAVRPSTKRWHWRHTSARPTNCTASYESEWHLAVKYAARSHGYEVEYTFGDWRFDAFSDRSTFIVIEAVNSFSPRYFDKIDALKELGSRALWVINMDLTTKSKWLELRLALEKANATIWIVGSFGLLHRAPNIVTDLLAVKIDAEVNGITYDAALCRRADANVEALRLQESERKIRAEADARYEAAQREHQKKNQWKSKHKFSETVEWVKAKMGAEDNVAIYIAWTMLDRKGETRVGMPETPPELDGEARWLISWKFPRYKPMSSMSPSAARAVLRHIRGER